MHSRKQLAREREFRRCRGKSQTDLNALIYWLEKYVKIQHPEHGAIPFKLREAQREILETWLTERYSIVLKARQIGWSTLAAALSLWLCFFWSDRNIVMLSRTENDAKKLLKKADYAYKRLPQWMRDRGPKRLTDNVKDITFANGSMLESLPSKEDPARGTAVTLVIVDEWAFLDDPEAAWASIEPISDVGGRVIGLSTANGWGDFFHTMWVKATAGISQFKPMFYPWFANTDRDDTWYESKKRSMEEWQLHQEYPSTPEEAFIKSGRPVFDTDVLRAISPVEPRRGYLDITDGGMKAPKYRDQRDGALRLWKMPQRDDSYAIGADVAMGLEHGDYSCAHVVSFKTGRVVAVWHAHMEPDLFADELVKLAWFYNRALLGPEANSFGHAVVKQIQRRNYPRLFVRRSADDSRTLKGQFASKVGWLTTQTTKPLAIAELQRALREDLVLEDAETVAELLTYVRDEKGGMAGSPYDDRVMSLAIANQMRKYLTHQDYQQEEDRHNTVGALIERLIAEHKQETRREPIGTHNVR